MAKHNDIGHLGEELAIAYFENIGFKIVEKNFRFEKAEIDLIAQKANCIVFIEVKTRTSNFEFPEKAVNKRKRMLLTIAAQEYLQKNAINLSIRFDILSIFIHDSVPQFTHIEDAFFEIGY